jgi:hypothetical protein
VHGKEFVFNAPVTARLGREDLEALHRGEAQIQRPGFGTTSQAISVGVFDSRQNLDTWLRSGAGRTAVLDIFKQNRHEFL